MLAAMRKGLSATPNNAKAVEGMLCGPRHSPYKRTNWSSAIFGSCSKARREIYTPNNDEALPSSFLVASEPPNARLSERDGEKKSAPQQ